MKGIKNIIFEYFTFISVIAPLLFLNGNGLNGTLVMIMFALQFKHIPINWEVDRVYINKSKCYTEKIRRKKKSIPSIISFMDILTVFAAVYIFYGDFDKYTSILITFLWFMVTDIFRTRKTIYGTYISRWLYTSKIDINNSKWELHKADKDPFPSIPHMHSKDKPLKLNVYNGEIYNSKTNKLVDVASKKDLKKLWSDEKFRSSVKEAREIYLKDNPKTIIPDIPNF